MVSQSRIEGSIHPAWTEDAPGRVTAVEGAFEGKESEAIRRWHVCCQVVVLLQSPDVVSVYLGLDGGRNKVKVCAWKCLLHAISRGQKEQAEAREARFAA